MARELDAVQGPEATPVIGRAPTTAGVGAAGLIGLQRTAGNRAVGAMLARQGRTLARCPDCGGRCASDDRPDPKEEELTRVLARTPGTAPRQLARCKCEHDGKRACGPIMGKFGVEDSDTGIPGQVTIDNRIVKQGMAVIDPGAWATQVLSPPNPEKGGEDRGWVDGLKVAVGDELSAEVVEVKARRGGGCCLASREADGYVRVLTAIAPEIQRVSELATANGSGLRAPPGTPATKVWAMLRAAGIDVGLEKMAYAWAFYNSLQNRLDTTFVKPFRAVRFKVNAGGHADTSHFIEPPVLIRCKDKDGTFWGIERLVFQVNQKGGVSYGCVAVCKRNRKRSKEEEAAIAAYERRQATQPATDATKDEVVDAQEAEQEEEAQTLRPAAITALLPELQAEPLARHLQAGLNERFGSEPSGRRFYFLASQAFVTEFVGKPRAQRTTDLLKARVPTALGFRAINSQMVFWFYGVPMAIAIIVAVTRGAGAPAAAAAAPMAEGLGGAAGEGLTLATLRTLEITAVNDNAIKIAAQAAGVVLVLTVARTASADEPDWALREVHGIQAAPVDAVGGAEAGIGDEVEYGGFKRVVVGAARVP